MNKNFAMRVLQTVSHTRAGLSPRLVRIQRTSCSRSDTGAGKKSIRPLSGSRGECSRMPLRRVATRTCVLKKRLVFVVAAQPDAARLVAPLGSAVEPRVHAPESVQSARIGGIGVVDDAVLERER